jgi:predicted Zn-dependent protease
MKKALMSLVSMLTVLAGTSLLQGSLQGFDAAIEAYEHGKFQSAADILSGLSERDPTDINLRIWLAKTYIKLHRWDDAILKLERAVALEPQNTLGHLWLARAYGEKAAHVSFFSAFGLARKTYKEFEAAAKLSPDNLDIRFDLLEFYAQAPGFLGGGRDKAAAQAAEIAKRAPRAGYTARASLFAKDKAWDRALAELIQATVKFPNDPDGYNDLAEFLLQRREYQRAESNAQQALTLNAANRNAKLLVAASRIELRKDLNAAVRVLQELAAGPLTDHDPTFEDVYYWLGRAYLALGQKAEARQALQASLSFDPDNSRSKEALAQIK